MESKRPMISLLIFISFIIVFNSTFAEVLMPKEGNSVKKSGILIIDDSNCSEGYVMVKTKPTKKSLKLRVVHDSMDIHYNLNSDGKYEVFPLQDGDGKYVFTLYECVKNNSYRELNSISIFVEMPDPNRCFLYPNQYINYTPETPAVIFSQKLCEGLADPEEKVKKIYSYIAWDEDKTETWIDENGQLNRLLVPRIESATYGLIGSLPEIDRVFTTNKGACKDVSGLMTAMLRSVGVPTKYMVGKCGFSDHAWICVMIGDKEIEMDPQDHIYDPDLEELRIHQGSGYKAERWY